MDVYIFISVDLLDLYLYILLSTPFWAVVVPDRALVLDWVFADGPPQKAIVYDNNYNQDFHAIVPKCISEELYWVEEEHQMYKKLQEERRLREEAIREKVSLHQITSELLDR